MPHSLTPRQDQRKPVTISATCRTGTGLRDEGCISDISPSGCCLETKSLVAKVGASIVIRPVGMEGIGATVRWIQGSTMGLEFNAPLYQPVVDHLIARHGAYQPVAYTRG